MSYQELKSAENNISETCDYFVSTPDLINNEPKPLFFYHIKKTGGMTLDLVLRLNVERLTEHLRRTLKSPNFNMPLCNRIEADFPASRLEQVPAMFICGHVQYGYHKEISNNFDTLAIFREPLSRTVSNYTYLCMRENRPSSIEGFVDHMEKNTNVMTKAMCQSPQDWSIEEAKQNIDELVYVALVKDIRTIVEYYLSSFGLPNVLSPRLNLTDEKFSLILNDSVREQFYKLNEADTAIYHYAVENRRIPKLKRNSEALSDLTTILFEEENTEDHKLKVMGALGSTELVLDMLNKQSFPTVRNVFMKLAGAE